MSPVEAGSSWSWSLSGGSESKTWVGALCALRIASGVAFLGGVLCLFSKELGELCLRAFGFFCCMIRKDHGIFGLYWPYLTLNWI